MIGWLIIKIVGIALIIGGITLEIAWVTFLFGSVLGIVLLLIFAPSWFFAPLTLTVMGVALLVSGEMPKSRSNSEYIDAEVIDYDKR
jgi:hypothetical protein